MRFEKWLDEQTTGGATTTADIAKPLAYGKVDVIGADCPDGYKWDKKKRECVPVKSRLKEALIIDELAKRAPNTAKWKEGEKIGRWRATTHFGDVRDVDGEAWAYMPKTREFLHLGTTKELKKMKKTARWLPESVESIGFYKKIRTAQNRGKAQRLAKEHGVHPSNVGYVYLDYSDSTDDFIKQAYERTKKVLKRPKISDVNRERQELILANLERVMKERGIKK